MNQKDIFKVKCQYYDMEIKTYRKESIEIRGHEELLSIKPNNGLTAIIVIEMK